MAGFVDLFEKTRQVQQQAEQIRRMERRDFEERLAAENAALRERIRLAVFGADIAQALVQRDSLATMLHHCTDAMVRHLHAAFARIWTLNAAASVLDLQASSGLYTHLNGPHCRVAVGQYKIGLIAQERKPHLTNAVQSDPRVSDKAWPSEAMVAFAGYPLIVEDQLVGVMALFARENSPLPRWRRWLPWRIASRLGIERKRSEDRFARAARMAALTLSQHRRRSHCHGYCGPRHLSEPRGPGIDRVATR